MDLVCSGLFSSLGTCIIRSLAQLGIFMNQILADHRNGDGGYERCCPICGQDRYDMAFGDCTKPRCAVVYEAPLRDKRKIVGHHISSGMA